MAPACWLSLLAVSLAFPPDSRPGRKPEPAQAEVVKVLIWYSKRDPLKTFSYQVYHRPTPEKLAAVDAWIRQLQAGYPSYEAYLRSFDLTRAAGANEDAKVAGLLSRELMMIAGYYYGLDLSASLGRGPGGLGPPAQPIQPLPPMLPSPGSGAWPNPAYSAPRASPFPYPYVRPHP